MYGVVFNCNNKLVGKIDNKENVSLITMEVDLRSKESKKRTLKYFVNNKQLNHHFINLPSKVNFVVYYLIICNIMYNIILYYSDMYG